MSKDATGRGGTILAYGEVLWDVLPGGSVLGGAPFNLAYRAKSLGDRSLMASRLGRDDLGVRAFERMGALGMDTALIQWDQARPTGTVNVSFDENRNPDYYIVPGVAYDAIEMTAALREAAKSADCLSFGTLIQREEASRRTLYELIDASPDSIRFLDINLRRDCFTEETVAASLEKADMLKLNADEARVLSRMFGLSESRQPGLAMEMMDRWSLSHCLVTFGESGALACARGEGAVYMPGYRVKVADTVGSGDAFAAGFVHMHLAGRSLAECVEFANAMGALVAMQEGATAPLSAADVERFVESSPERIREPGMERLTTC